jgi:hypothetical protein
MTRRLLRAIARSIVLPGLLPAQGGTARDSAWVRATLSRLTLRQ